jgi:hypothetical protein
MGDTLDAAPHSGLAGRIGSPSPVRSYTAAVNELSPADDGTRALLKSCPTTLAG